MMYFKILTEHHDPNPVVIDETELPKAILGQLTGNPAVFKTASLSGSMIKNSKIIPDFDKVKKIYNPWGEDKVPPTLKQAHFLAIENAGEVVKAKMENRPPQLKSPSVQIHTRGTKSLGEIIK
jgi:hypothetical protein